MELIKKIVKFISTILYLCIFVYAIIATPLVVGYKPVVVLSGSMEPTYPVGGIVYYKSVDASQIKENDVITFSMGDDALVTHRVIRVTDEGFVTKGDANNTEDFTPVSGDRVRGVVARFYFPYLGYCVQFFNNHFYILWIVMVVLILDFVLSNINFDKNKDKEVNGKKKSATSSKEDRQVKKVKSGSSKSVSSDKVKSKKQKK